MLRNEAALVDHMATNDFALSQQDIEALETDAPAHIPKLLARAYVKTMANTMAQMNRVIPAMVQKITAVQKRNTENEGKFYSRWPMIDRAQHGETVARLARTYRQMNPSASLDQMVEELGPVVMMTAKIPLSATAVASNGAAAPPTRTPPQGFRPALPGTTAPPNAPVQDPWSGLAGHTDDEE